MFFRDDDQYRPKASGGAFGYGLTRDQLRSATASDHLKRAATFATFGSGAKREDFLNSIGMLTREQKNNVNKLNSKGRPSAINKTFSKMIPATTLFGLGLTASGGGDGIDQFTNFIIPEVAAFAGWRTGKSLGFAAATKLGGNTADKMLMGIAGGITGGVIAGAAAYGVMEAVRSSAQSENFIKKLHHNITGADFKTEFVQNQNTLTSRRRAMDKLSKSALNDRGQLLGNEAMVLKGIM